MFIRIILKYFILWFLVSTLINAQNEYEPLTNYKLYSFLEKMYANNIINYNISSLPLSRKEIIKHLKEIDSSSSKINLVEKNILDELKIDFEIEKNDSLIINISNELKSSIGNIFKNGNKKYLYFWSDDNANFYLSSRAFVSYRSINDKNKSNIGLGGLGLKFRGSLYDELGYYINLTTAQQISGKNEARQIFSNIDPYLSSTRKFVSDKYVDRFEGYLRFNRKDYLFITIGRENFTLGNGFYNKLFISNNAAPFDFLKLDLNYKSIYYSYIYGNIRGDSLGKPLTSKHIITHRLDFKFSRYFNFGFWEAVITPNRSISFNFLNPIVFLRTASYSSEELNEDNLLMGLDVMSKPLNNLLTHFSFLIDDLNFSTLFKDKRDNKFAYQFGVRIYNLFGVDNLIFTTEYIKISPFVYTHRSNKSTYSHWNINLGPSLEPNSDELALGINYWLSKRIIFDTKLKYKRHAEGIKYDKNGKIIYNYGGNLLDADGDLISQNIFLDGNRNEYVIIETNLNIEPIKQFYLEIFYQKKILTMPKNLPYKYDLIYVTIRQEI